MVDPSEERIHKLVRNAFHESVSGDILTQTKGGIASPWLYKRPLISYLRSTEQPHFVLYAESQVPSTYGPEAPTELSRSRPYRVMHLITDERWLMVAGNRNENDTLAIPLSDLEEMNYETEGGLSSRLSNNEVVVTIDGAYLSIPISNDFDETDLATLATYLEEEAAVTTGELPPDPEAAGYTVDGVDTYEPSRESIAQLLDEVPTEAEEEVDRLIRDADDAEELEYQLSEVIQQYENEEKSIDDLVAEAESAEQLRIAVESPLESIRRQAETGIEDISIKARDRFEEADRNEMATWGLNVGKAGAPLAVAAPFPTTAGLLALVGAGALGGIHKSSTDDSLLDDIDPAELAEHVQALATAGGDLDHIDGRAAGVILGAASYLGQTVLPETYAQWFVEADVEAVMKGAELGAAAARDQDESARLGAVLGGGIGLLHSYTSPDETGFSDVVDGDLYKNYLEEHTRRDLSLPK